MFVVIEETHDGDLFLGMFYERRDAERYADELRKKHSRGCFVVVDKAGPHDPHAGST